MPLETNARSEKRSAIIPRGTWQVINARTRKAMIVIVYDSNGNPINVKRFKENGNILSEENFPSHDKRIW